MDISPFIDIVEDLNRDLPPIQRYQRLVAAIARSAPCDVIALLKLEGDYLVPVAQLGLKREAMARRFNVYQHPRLEKILYGSDTIRFDADSPLPDPYDGLVENGGEQLHVHDCLGFAIALDDHLWGVLTLDALDRGAFDVLGSTQTRAYTAVVSAVIKTSEHIGALQSQLEHRQQVVQRLLETEHDYDIIGRSTALSDMLQEIDTVAPTELSVLITGETGVGKELVAKRIHQHSTRREQPLVPINCAALPETIVESELFGHVRGAFSGATSDRSGRFELADGGTLFLDEVGELPLPVQAKLLRALQSGEIQRVGSDRVISVDVRLVAATNRDLNLEVKAGRFRADLYHRLSVYPLPVPPLRERGSDCELLAGYFLERSQHQLGVARLRLTSDASKQLQAYDWPGNVRELQHLLSRAALKAIREQGRDCDIISIDSAHLDLQPGLTGIKPAEAQHAAVAVERPVAGFRDSVETYQRHLIEQQLQSHGGNLAATARALKLDRSNLVRTMTRLGLGG